VDCPPEAEGGLDPRGGLVEYMGRGMESEDIHRDSIPP